MSGVFFISGALSALSQVLVLRELAFAFPAHEAALAAGLAAWLGWTAFSAAGRGEGLSLAAALSALGLTAAATPALCRLFTSSLLEGTLPGPGLMLAGVAACSLPAALANGLLIRAGLREGGSRFYLLETAGGALAGLAATAALHLLPALPLGSPALALSAAGLAALPGPSRARKAASLALLLALPAAYLPLENRLRAAALPCAAPRLVETPYTRLGACVSGGRSLVYEGSYLSAEFPPPPEAAETAAHVPLLAGPRRPAVLAIGPGAFGLAAEAAKHKPSRFDYADPDSRRAEFLAGLAGSSMTYVRADGREHLRRSPGVYDLVLQTWPSPSNAASNRFFTEGFFREAAGALKKGGTLAFSVPSSENYMPPEARYLSASVLAAASASFETLRFVPGRPLGVLARSGPFELSPGDMERAYMARGLDNRWAVPGNFGFILDPFRRDWVLNSVKAQAPPNTDLSPAAYFAAWRAWGSMAAGPGTAAALGLALIAAIWLLRRGAAAAAGHGLAAAAAFGFGAWAMALEVAALSSFAAATGQLTPRLGALFAVFMAGGAAGAALPGRFAGRRSAALAALPAAALSFWLGSLAGPLGFGGAALALFAAGALTGIFFRSASSFASPGLVYGADLWGAAAGAYAAAVFLVPLAGIPFAAGFSALALIPAALLALPRK